MEPVCLITPPSGFLADQKVFVSLGILRVAACLERDGYAVDHLDLAGIENYTAVVREYAFQNDTRFYGLTATTPQMPAAMKVLTTLREVCPHSRVILGGPHVTLVSAACKRERKKNCDGRATRAFRKLADAFDVLVAGDGDDAIFEAMKDDAPKLVDADDPKGTLFLTNKRYEELPFPARHLVDMDSYHYMIDGVRSTSAIFQLGCPFACNFCTGRLSPMLRHIRTRTKESVVGEIRHLYEQYGYLGIMDYEDEANLSKDTVPLMNAIADLGEELGVQFRLRGFIKAELFTDEQAKAMYRAGFRVLLCGFESGSPRVLDSINKKATREDNSRCIDIARRHGLKVKALMSAGHPGESAATIRDTKEWLLQERPDDFDLTVITVYPGCPYYDAAVETQPSIWTYTARNGDRLHSYEIDYTEDESYYKGVVGEYKSHVFTDHLTAEELVRLRDELEADVRKALGIPYNPCAAAVQYEHSMGMGIPANILRRSPVRVSA